MKSLTSSDKTGILIMLACALSLGSLAGLAVAARSNTASVIDTGCKGGTFPHSHLVILVDTTDPMSRVQNDYVLSRVNEEAETTERGNRISVFRINGEREELIEPLFSRCSPRNPARANPLYQNPGRIRKRFDHDFREPLLAAIQREPSDAEASSSPILESIKAVSELREFSAIIPERKLVIISDMLQNVQAYSHYEGADYEDFVGSAPYVSVVTPDLSGVEVEVVYLRRVRDRSFQTPSHAAFWEQYFSDSGVARLEMSKR